MKYATSGEGDGFDQLTIQMIIECFNSYGESGPHSPEGWALSHILEHCHANSIPFTLVFHPENGYYLKREIFPGVVPEEMREAFER